MLRRAHPDICRAPAQGSPIVDVSTPRSEFLNADDVMSGMKQKEAAQGLVFASGQYYVKNPNAGQDGEPELIPVRDSQAGGSSRQAIRDYKAGDIDAETFFNDYVKKTQDEIETADDPVETQDDPVVDTEDEEDPTVTTV